jgi:hypothetical protein
MPHRSYRKAMRWDSFEDPRESAFYDFGDDDNSARKII